jgi:diadenylate cyclase
MVAFLENLLLILQRLNWVSILDIGLVTLMFYVVLIQFRGTQAGTVLRGVVILLAIVALLTNVTQLPAFSYILRTILPALLFTVPVIFAPEIRRTLELVGRADFLRRSAPALDIPVYLQTVVTAAGRLSERHHGALIVIERDVGLEDFASTGVRLDSESSTELLLQIFYPNTPLHDGAVIFRGGHILAAGCVVPLSSSESATPADRRMGLRHRAAIGISEVSDAVAVVVSEETGIISVAHNGRMIRRLDPVRLQNILAAFTRGTRQPAAFPWQTWFRHRVEKPTRFEKSDPPRPDERRPA